MARYHYAVEDVIACLKKLGVSQGDVLFSHVSLLNLGFAKDNPVSVILDAIARVIGKDGSFLTPTYTYSFCGNKDFDIIQSPSTVGPFGNELLQRNDVSRSRDPLFSVAGFGPHLKSLFSNLPPSSFGPDCLYQRLESIGAKICNIGLNLFYLTPIHTIEKEMSVPYRFDKLFSGNIIENGQTVSTPWIYFVRHLTDASRPNCTPLEQLGTAMGICRSAKLGLGHVHLAAMQDYLKLARKQIAKNPWFLAEGPPFNPADLPDR